MLAKHDMTGWVRQLVSKMTCPNCWHHFYTQDVFFVARHPELLGDPVLGDNEYLRFLPTRFTPKGEAIDPRGMVTAELACPRCHLQIPEAMLEVLPLFISIVGSPASGKSYFLTTMTWQLRQLMPQFELVFNDADPIANSPIHEYEQTLFLNPQPDRPTEIHKTQTDDPKLHRTAIINDVAMRFPLPFQFSFLPTPQHPMYEQRHRIGRILVLYDNAGEDFLPAAENPDSAAIQHLAKSHMLFMLFDPLQDPRFLKHCRSDDPQVAHGLRPAGQGPAPIRQEIILKEAAVRVRRYLGLSENARIKKPLIVIVPKFDVWGQLLDMSLDEEPYAGFNGASAARMDLQRVEKAHARLKELFRRLCPEFAATAEAFTTAVRYVPVSSLGCSPSLIRRGKLTFYGVRPENVHPKWVTVPLLYCLCKWTGGLIGKVEKNGEA